MKPCSYCGKENDEAALRCGGCGEALQSLEEAVDPALTDPAASLRIVATFGDVEEASLARDQLTQAGIEACIPEELDPSPFGNFKPLANVTVRVAQKDYEAAKALLDSPG
jgi:hypothetical protein